MYKSLYITQYGSFLTMNKNIYKMNGRRVELFYEFSENASLFGNMCLFDENTLLCSEKNKIFKIDL